MGGSGSATEAAQLAPQASLHAAKVGDDAEKAFRDGDLVGAEALAEEALAAYAHAEVLARLARADERSESAASHVAQVQTEFATLDTQQHEVAAEADDAEARFKVARDAVPLATTEPGTPEREQARLAAAKSLSVEARLLCVAAQMLAPDTQGVADDFKAIDALDAGLAKAPSHPAIDTAVRLRSACLGELTSVRRSAADDAPERGAADALLDELGKAGLSPSRDNRGVVVALREAFQGNTLRPEAHERVVALGQVARAHATFPLLVVSHAAGSSNRIDDIVKVLTEAGAPKVRATRAGNALPLSPPGRPGASASNERIEIVFVAPSN